MNTGLMNTDLLVSDTRSYRIDYRINPYMDPADQPDPAAARREHEAILRAHRAAGRRVRRMPSAPDCPDMVYTANVAVVAGGRAVLGAPPAERAGEIPHARTALEGLGIDVVAPPYPFSGQGDALACGDLLLVGHGQRTDARMPAVLADELGYDRDRVIELRTSGPAFYDLDLAVGVAGPDLVAWCPDGLDAPSRRRVQELREHGVRLVEVDAAEAAAFACNLVGDGRSVTMTTGAPRLAAALRGHGLDVTELTTRELALAGGGIRCTALALDTPDPTSARPAVAAAAVTA